MLKRNRVRFYPASVMLGLCWLLGACGGGGNSSNANSSTASSSSASTSSTSSSSSSAGSSSSSSASTSSTSSSSSSASSSSSSSGSSVLGLDARPSNTSCIAWERPASNDSITLERVFASLSFTSPVAMLQAPGDNSRWFVVQQGGVVRKFDVASPVASNFIDIDARVDSTGSEMGLLGMAFHPGFPGDPRVFLSYTATVAGQVVSRISSFTTPDGGQTLNPSSEQILLTVNQPESNHNGGHIAFGKDGFLYIGFGDGGGGGDNHGSIGNGQNLNTLLGKILRIDVGSSSATTYSVPSSNPFAANAQCSATGGSAPCPEIYAWGFRNPWRWSFDKLTGELWVGDVGQNTYEEIDQVELGGNYGWRVREGAHCYNAASCTTSGLIDPVAEYDHGLGGSVTGGYAYRGTQTTSLYGRYLFGDFITGRIWAWLPEQVTAPREPTQLFVDGNRNISSFGEANNGELYVVDYNGGLYHINFTANSSGGIVPNSLADTGCVNSSNPAQAASGLIPYDINAPFWSDGASKERWLALPNGQNISIQSNGDWNVPNGSVLIKNFRVNNQLIETRLLMRHFDGSWSGYTYEWNDAQTAATRVQGGKTRTLTNNQVWIYPSESQCLECHTNVAGRSLGLMTAQLNRSYLYASTGRTANQLDTLSGINVLSPAVSSAGAASMANPADTTASLTSRARAYLQTNCAQCHQPSGPTPSNMDLRFDTPLASTNTCNIAPVSGSLGLTNAMIVAAGNAASSVLIERIKRRDAHGMPPLGSNLVDTGGVDLLTDWVNSLSGC